MDVAQGPASLVPLQATKRIKRHFTRNPRGLTILYELMISARLLIPGNYLPEFFVTNQPFLRRGQQLDRS